jgi:hypothetical protein
MAKSLDKVLQADGSYKWELVELTSEYIKSLESPVEPEAAPAQCPAIAPLQCPAPTRKPRKSTDS